MIFIGIWDRLECVEWECPSITTTTRVGVQRILWSNGMARVLVVGVFEITVQKVQNSSQSVSAFLPIP